MSISPVSAYNLSQHYSVSTSGGAGVDEEHRRIMQKMRALGLNPTGNKANDMALLSIVLRQMQANKTEKNKAKDSIPFEDIMNTLNIKVSGNLEKDYNTTINDLDYKIGMASSDDKKLYYQTMKDTVESQYNSSKKNSVGSFSGASQISDMNRYFML